MFNIQTLPTPRNGNNQSQPFTQNHWSYTPQYSSPLSSSPLRSSPLSSPLSERCDNLPSSSGLMTMMANDHKFRNGGGASDDQIMSSPTSRTKRWNGSGNSWNQRLQQQQQQENQKSHDGQSDSATIFTTAKLTPSSSTTSKGRSNNTSNNIFQSPNIPTPPHTISTNTTTTRPSTFSTRPTKHNPLLHTSREQGRETRRKLFLKKVREGSEEKRWAARGGDEEIMRVLWAGEVARENERRRMEARGFGGREEEGGEELTLEEVEADEVARREEAELEALLMMQRDLEEEEERLMGGGGFVDVDHQQQSASMSQSLLAAMETSSLYGSDDDEYDSIFQDVIQEEIRMSQQQSSQPLPSIGGDVNGGEDQDMMDLS